jgi:hypothetical protein
VIDAASIEHGEDWLRDCGTGQTFGFTCPL